MEEGYIANESASGTSADINTLSEEHNVSQTTEGFRPGTEPVNRLTIKILQMDQSVTPLTGICPEASILELKNRIRQEINIPSTQQRLIFRGKVLEQTTHKLSDYGISDGDCIHLLKRADGSRESVAGIQHNTPTAVGRRTLFDASELSSLITDQINRHNRPRSQRLGRPIPVGDNLEHLFQDIATLETFQISNVESAERRKRAEEFSNEYLEGSSHTNFLEAVNSLDDDPVQIIDDEVGSDSSWDESVEGKVNSISGLQDFVDQQESEFRKKFKVGQWIDCCDTVNQWLEATVIRVYPETSQIRVHYNGWGTRWDETIDSSSDRIARFRTRTQNGTQSRNFSPTIKHWVDNIPKIVESNNLANAVSAVNNSIQPVLEQLNRVSNDEYGFCRDVVDAEKNKKEDILQLATSLDIIGRALADLGGALADRPAYARRYERLRLPQNLFSLSGYSLLPFGFKASIEQDRTLSGEWNRNERNDRLTTLGYDRSLYAMSHTPNEMFVTSRPPRNLELHLHALVAPEVSRELETDNEGGSNTTNAPRPSGEEAVSEDMTEDNEPAPEPFIDDQL